MDSTLSTSLSHLELLVIHYKYAIMLPLMIFEGPIITAVGGFLSSLHYLNLGVVYILAVLGDLIGDLFYYGVGRYGKKIAVKYNLFSVSRKRFEKFERYFRHHGGKILLLSKMTQLIGGAMLAAAGAAEIPFGTYLKYTVGATLPKSLFFLLAGYYLGTQYSKANTYFSYVSITAIALSLILVVFYIFKAVQTDYKNKYKEIL